MSKTLSPNINAVLDTVKDIPLRLTSKVHGNIVILSTELFDEVVDLTDGNDADYKPRVINRTDKPQLTIVSETDFKTMSSRLDRAIEKNIKARMSMDYSTISDENMVVADSKVS
jgi:PHD/YefM family antitoxin component YafN of YafNO toxin-antitoxin module